MKKLYNIFVLMLILLSLSVKGQDNYYQNLFLEANGLYTEGKYDSALTNYQEIERSGLTSFELFFNQGNTAFKLNNLPLAILNYERANRIKSSDKDLKHNLSLANNQITDKIEKLPELFILSWIDNISNLLNSTYWAWINIVLFFLFLLSLASYFRLNVVSQKVLSFYGTLLFSFLFALTIAFGIKRYNFETNQNSAIVFQPSLTVKSEPSDNSTDLFLVHEGIKIKILETAGSWSKISLPDGNIGWVNSSSYQII